MASSFFRFKPSYRLPMNVWCRDLNFLDNAKGAKATDGAGTFCF